MCLQQVYLMYLTQPFRVNFTFARLVVLLISVMRLGYCWQIFVRLIMVFLGRAISLFVLFIFIHLHLVVPEC